MAIICLRLPAIGDEQYRDSLVASLTLGLSMSTHLTHKLADLISNWMSMSGVLISNGIYLNRVLGSNFKTRLEHFL